MTAGVKSSPVSCPLIGSYERILSMKSHAVWVSLLVVAYLGLCLSADSNAAVTFEHKKQIDEARKEVGKVKTLIAKKEFDEAAKLLADAEQKLKQVAKDAGVEENNKLLAGVFKQIKDNQELLAKRRPGAAEQGAGRRQGFSKATSLRSWRRGA